MGLFSNLFGFGSRRRVETLMNPLLEMRLREFVIADDNPGCMKHYFRFDDKDGKVDEFVVIYQRWGSELNYLRTHWRRVGNALEFRTLSDRGPWPTQINYLIDLGQRLSATTRPTKGHFVSKVSTEDLIDPDWVPPTAIGKAKVPPQATQPKQSAVPPQVDDDEASPSVKTAEWQASVEETAEPQDQHGKITKAFEFTGLPSPHTTTSLSIECCVSRYPNGNLGTDLHFLLRPYLYLMPNREPFEDHLTTSKCFCASLSFGSAIIGVPDKLNCLVDKT